MTSGIQTHQSLQEMKEINQTQASFYELSGRRGNFATRIWSSTRNSIAKTRNAIGIGQAVIDLHWKWLGDISEKRVLDLGCYSGNNLSVALAERSKSYLGIDLSKPAIERLRLKLADREITNAEVRAVDFLSPEFTDKDFDIIYAYSVAHHFKHFEVFLQMLQERLVPGGMVITFDPLQTSLPIKVARILYRPFQSDKAWEWPFSKQNFKLIQKYFEIDAVQGIMGYSKYAVPFAILNHNYALKIGKRLHEKDLSAASRLGRGLWGCMQVTMCFKKAQ